MPLNVPTQSMWLLWRHTSRSKSGGSRRKSEGDEMESSLRLLQVLGPLAAAVEEAVE